MTISRRVLFACALALPAAVALAMLLLAPRDGSARTDRWGALRDAPLERTEVAAARVGRFVYVVGGFESSNGATSAAVERYDLRADRWRGMRDMPLALNHPTAVAYRGRVYVHGGYSAAGGLADPTNALLRFDLERNRWHRLASSATPRAAHAAAVVGDRLYVAGGTNDSGSLRSLEVYSFRHGSLDASAELSRSGSQPHRRRRLRRAFLRGGGPRRRQPVGGRPLRPAPAILAGAAAGAYSRGGASVRLREDGSWSSEASS